MHYRIELEFLCHDHRLRGTVEWDADEHKLWTLTLSQLLDEMRPLILHRYPYVDDAIERIEILNLGIEKL